MLLSEWEIKRLKYIKQRLFDLMETKTCGVYDKNGKRCENRVYKIEKRFCKKHQYLRDVHEQNFIKTLSIHVNINKKCQYTGCDRFSHYLSDFCPLHEDSDIRCINKDDYEQFDRLSYGKFNKFEDDKNKKHFQEYFIEENKHFQETDEELFEIYCQLKEKDLDGKQESEFRELEIELNNIFGSEY